MDPSPLGKNQSYSKNPGVGGSGTGTPKEELQPERLGRKGGRTRPREKQIQRHDLDVGKKPEKGQGDRAGWRREQRHRPEWRLPSHSPIGLTHGRQNMQWPPTVVAESEVIHSSYWWRGPPRKQAGCLLHPLYFHAERRRSEVGVGGKKPRAGWSCSHESRDLG